MTTAPRNIRNTTVSPRIVAGRIGNYIVITKTGERIPCHNLATARLLLKRNS